MWALCVGHVALVTPTFRLRHPVPAMLLPIAVPVPTPSFQIDSRSAIVATPAASVGPTVNVFPPTTDVLAAQVVLHRLPVLMQRIPACSIAST